MPINKDIKAFKEIVKEALTYLGTIPGGATEFRRRFKRSQATLSNWKNGKSLPSEEDRIYFLELVVDVIEELKVSKCEFNSRRESVMKRYAEAVS